MESWPKDDRDAEELARKERKGKKKDIAHYPYPNLNHGLVEALTLQEKDGRFSWLSIEKHSNVDSSPIQAGKPVQVFPATRSPALPPSQTRLSHRAEQGANFLRTHFPDVDVTAELVREEIENDAKNLSEQSKFNPMDGSMIEYIVQYQSLVPRDIYLAFPMGELFNELNISPFLPQRVFKPSATPVKTFATPISQIISPNMDHTVCNRDPLFAVRTYTSVSIMEMKTDVPFVPTVNELAQISPSDVGGRPIIDIKLASFSDALVVNDQGVVYVHDTGASTATVIFDYSDLNSMSEVLSDDFWRIATTERPSGCLLTSGKVLRYLDTRSGKPFTELFSIHNPVETLTAVEPQDGHLIRLCSTSEVLWIDDRSPGKPLLGYQHHLQYDRTLESRTFRVGTDTLTFLTSIRSGMVNVYDVSRAQDDTPLRLNHSPYSLTCASPEDGYMIGQTFVQYPQMDDAFSLFRLSDKGSLHRLDCTTPGDSSCGTHEWSQGVSKLHENMASLQPQVGPLGNRDYIQEDLSHFYSHLYRDLIKTEEKEDKKAKAVYDLVDRAPNFWQDSDMPLEHMLNTYDILFRTGDEPEQTARSDFLTGSLLNSTRGFRAFQQGKLSADRLSKGASWHQDIAATLRHFDSTVSDNIDETFERLKAHDLVDTDAIAQRREKKAREQLSLDLTMAGHIFSPIPFTRHRPPCAEDDLELMTQALSIDAEPPAVAFHYLQPVLQASIKRPEPDEDTEHAPCDELEGQMDYEPQETSWPLGVRLLLKDWETGTHPDDFVYADPYTEPSSRPTPMAAPQKPRTMGFVPTNASRAQAPPTIAASTAFAPPAIASSRPVFGSQPPALRSFAQSQVPSGGGYSQGLQEPMASTQVLPGPHGGRPVPAKKKSFKKRTLGF